MVEIKSAHKLTALCILVALCVAGYIIFDDTGPAPEPPTPKPNSTSKEWSPTTTTTSIQASTATGDQQTSASSAASPSSPSAASSQPTAASSPGSSPATQSEGSPQGNAQQPTGATISVSPGGQSGASPSPAATSSGDPTTTNAISDPSSPSPGPSSIETSAATNGNQMHSIPEAATSVASTTNELQTSPAGSSPIAQDTPPSAGGSSTTGAGELQQTPAGLTDRTPDELDRWQEFKRHYRRQYPSAEEELKRQAIFVGNLRFIRTFNDHSQALFKLGINQFADFTQEETNQLFVGRHTTWTPSQLSSVPRMKILSSDGPSAAALAMDSAGNNHDSSQQQQQQPFVNIDWRNLTSEPPVDQGTCLDSSLFAIIAGLESALNAAQTTGPMGAAGGANGNSIELFGGAPSPTGQQLANNNNNRIKLSEQQLIDCLARFGQELQPNIVACQGSLSAVQVFEFLQKNQVRFATFGEYLEFKRSQAQTSCQLPTSVPEKPRIDNYVTVGRENIQEALQNSGPLVVAIDASQPTFHFYKSGLYHEMSCSTDTYNLHALLVGYSSANIQTGDSSQATYTIRASFGPNWGEAGYMRLLRDETRNKCLPQHQAYYPNLAFN